MRGKISTGVKSIVKKVIKKTYPILGKYVHCAISPLYYGRRFTCPICGGHFRKFLPFATRSNAMCPKCGSLERHRLLWLYLRDKTNFITDNLKVLDIAPMDFLQRKFQTMPNLDYTSVDLESPIAMVKMDITDIKFPDNYFDCVICYHVLEHIFDDRKAMMEIFRVLKPGGWAILQVPILRDRTFEDPTITAPEQREKIFGQRDHVRIYGLDFKDRLESIRFIVKVDNYVKQLGDNTIKNHSLIKDESIYFCSKPNLARYKHDKNQS